MVLASDVSSSHKKIPFSKTIFLSSDPDELCQGLNLLPQEKQIGNNSDKINGEMVARVEKLLEYKCISTKELEILLLKSSN